MALINWILPDYRVLFLTGTGIGCSFTDLFEDLGFR